MNATLPQPDPSTYVPPASPVPPAPADARLVRPTHGRRIGGVCAAIADRYGWSRTTVRLVAVISVVLPGPQVLAYLIGWIGIPGETETAGVQPSF